MIGEGEDCDFKNLYSYSKHRFNKNKEDAMKTSKEIKEFK